MCRADAIAAVEQNDCKPPVAAANSVFLVDWDDTLLPTSALNRIGQLPDVEEELRWQLADGLRNIDAAAAQVLESALAVPGSDVTILTNACLDWVWTSSKRHLPEVHDLLRSGRVGVVSAHRPLPPKSGPSRESKRERERRQSAHLQTSVEWKDFAVRPLAKSLRSHWGSCAEGQESAAFQVVAIGDSPHDLQAGKTLGSLLKDRDDDKVHLKTVRMQCQPSVAELLAQLQILSKMLPTLAAKASHLECSMCRKTQNQAPASPALAPKAEPEDSEVTTSEDEKASREDQAVIEDAYVSNDCPMGAGGA